MGFAVDFNLRNKKNNAPSLSEIFVDFFAFVIQFEENFFFSRFTRSLYTLLELRWSLLPVKNCQSSQPKLKFIFQICLLKSKLLMMLKIEKVYIRGAF